LGRLGHFLLLRTLTGALAQEHAPDALIAGVRDIDIDIEAARLIEANPQRAIRLRAFRRAAVTAKARDSAPGDHSGFVRCQLQAERLVRAALRKIQGSRRLKGETSETLTSSEKAGTVS